jgi:acyl-CoA thioesterase I
MRIPSLLSPVVAGLLVALVVACGGDAPGPEGSTATPDTVVSAPGLPEGEPPAEGEGSALVIVLGTSLTEGYGLDRPGAQAWPARLEALAEAEGIRLEIRNAGLSGETSAGALRRVDWVVDTPPEIFILETGANDGLRGLAPQALEANLDSIFARVTDRAPDAMLVLAGMEAPPNLGASYVEAFRAVFSRVAERWDAVLVPFLLEGVAGVPALNQADGIHPTEEGHDIMAETVWEVLEPRLTRR